MMKKKFFAAILMAMALAAFSLAACDDSYVTPLTPVAVRVSAKHRICGNGCLYVLDGKSDGRASCGRKRCRA